jgi:hypothetical protein
VEGTDPAEEGRPEVLHDIIAPFVVEVTAPPVPVEPEHTAAAVVAVTPAPEEVDPPAVPPPAACAAAVRGGSSTDTSRSRTDQLLRPSHHGRGASGYRQPTVSDDASQEHAMAQSKRAAVQRVVNNWRSRDQQPQQTRQPGALASIAEGADASHVIDMLPTTAAATASSSNNLHAPAHSPFPPSPTTAAANAAAASGVTFDSAGAATAGATAGATAATDTAGAGAAASPDEQVPLYLKARYTVEALMDTASGRDRWRLWYAAHLNCIAAVASVIGVNIAMLVDKDDDESRAGPGGSSSSGNASGAADSSAFQMPADHAEFQPTFAEPLTTTAAPPPQRRSKTKRRSVRAFELANGALHYHGEVVRVARLAPYSVVHVPATEWSADPSHWVADGLGVLTDVLGGVKARGEFSLGALHGHGFAREQSISTDDETSLAAAAAMGSVPPPARTATSGGSGDTDAHANTGLVSLDADIGTAARGGAYLGSWKHGQREGVGILVRKGGVCDGPKISFKLIIIFFFQKKQS